MMAIIKWPNPQAARESDLALLPTTKKLMELYQGPNIDSIDFNICETFALEFESYLIMLIFHHVCLFFINFYMEINEGKEGIKMAAALFIMSSFVDTGLHI
jgi:hypothetical protein